MFGDLSKAVSGQEAQMTASAIGAYLFPVSDLSSKHSRHTGFQKCVMINVQINDFYVVNDTPFRWWALNVLHNPFKNMAALEEYIMRSGGVCFGVLSSANKGPSVFTVILWAVAKPWLKQTLLRDVCKIAGRPNIWMLPLFAFLWLQA